MKKTVTKRLLAVLMAFVMICSVCNVPDKQTEAASADDKYSKGYDISSLLGQFQYFVSNDVSMGNSGHTVGAVIVGGSLSLSNSFGDAAIVPSYIGNLKAGYLGNGWHGKYPNKCDTVYYGESDVPNLGENWIKNSNYIQMNDAFDAIKQQSKKLAGTDISNNNLTSENGKITIDCKGQEDIYVVIDADAFNKGVDIQVEDIDWFKKHICCISVTGQITEFNGNGNININGAPIGNKLKGMSGADEQYHDQLNVEGMNLVWNFPDTTGTIKTQGLGGHMVAPQATVHFEEGNYEGGVIAANITGSAEGHFYPMSCHLKGGEEKEEPENSGKTAEGIFSKKTVAGGDELSGASITLIYQGENSLGSVKKSDGPDITINPQAKTISWKSGEKPLKLSGLPAGEYTMVETGAPKGYQYAASIVFMIDDDGKIYKGSRNATTDQITYESTETTDPITMIDEAKAGKLKLEGTKVVTGIGAPTGENYSFIVKDDEGEEVATGTVTGAGKIDFTEITYGPEDIGTHKYTISEKKPTPVTEGMKYDEKAITVEVTVEDIKSKEVDGETVLIDDLTVTYKVTSAGGKIEFTNKYVTATGTFSKKAVTGGNELPDAKLKLSYSGNKDLKDVVAKNVTIEKSADNKTITWTSGDKAAELSGLPNGTYTMTETGAPEGYKYAEEIYFQVKDGKIYKGTKGVGDVITYEENATENIEMIDAAKSGKLTLNGKKEIVGDTTKEDEEYKFSVKDKDGKEIATASVTGSGTFEFTPALTYGPEDIGTHTYTVSEIKPTGDDITPGMIYDNTEYTVTVSVKDEGKDHDELTVTSTVQKGTEEVKGGITFTNRYYNPASAVFSKKAIAGGDELPGAELTLTYEGQKELEDVVKIVSGPEATINNKTVTWKSGNAPLELSDLPDGDYILREEGAPTGYKYADEIYFQVKGGKIYKGTKKGDSITYEKTATAEPIEMIDEAKAGTLTLEGTKTVTGKNAPKEEYKFSVKDNQGTEVATGSVTGSGAIKFTDIKYGPKDVGKQYIYTVSEVKPTVPTENMTYDTTVFTVTVTVSDVEEKDELVVAYTVSPKESIEFENTYKEPDKEEPTTTEEPTTHEPTTQEPTTENPTTEQQTVVTPPTGNLEIVVRDEKTKDPVPGATVEIVYPDGHKEEAKTDEHGQITKNDTPIGEYTITVTKVPEGYDVSTGQSAKALVETNKTTRHIAEIVTKTTVTTDSTAKTGDSFEVVVPMALLIYSAAVMILLGYGKKRR